MTFEIIDGRKAEAHREKMRERMRRYWSDPASRKRHSEQMRRYWANNPQRKIDRAKDPKALRMAQMYREGKTLAEIGDEFGITRERVRQLIRPLMTGQKGGRTVRAEKLAKERKEDRLQRQDSRCREEFGCDYETAIRLNLGLHPTHNAHGTRASAYLHQKKAMESLYHGVEYKLTFPQWVEAWGDKIIYKGRGKWALCRIDPTKGFTIDNVRPMEMREKSSLTLTRTKTRLHQIKSLEDAGCSNEQIAAQLGVSLRYLASLRTFARRMLP